MKRRAVLFGIVAVLAAGYLAFTVIAPVPASPGAAASGTTYSATVYVAGMGGHFAQADVVIDPANDGEPVRIVGLDRVVIGDSHSHPTHDARIDANDRNVLFWSTYKLDKDGKMHIGKSDLKTGNVIKDIALAPDKRSPGTKGPIYCASGQSRKYYMPVFMGTEGYIDVVEKKSMALKKRVFVSDIGYKPGSYKFLHGINSPDMKTFALALNQADEAGKGNGKVDIVLVDLKSLEKGKLKVLKKATFTGEPERTITFREYFSNDGRYLLQSAGDRFWVIDARTLKLVDEKIIPGNGQIHDAMPTPDNRYALLTVRTVTEGCDAEGKAIVKDGRNVEITDGVLYVYDMAAKKINEKSSSVCLGCHKGMGLGDKSAVLCGLDANYKLKI